MAVTATTVAAATTMLAAVAAVFLTFVLCFYIFLCAKRYRGGSPTGRGAAAWARFLLWGGNATGATSSSDAAAWCYEGGLDEKSMAKLPCREVAKGESLDCAVCITELAAGERARVLPRCGHAFHVACVDMWLKSHSTCPLCRRPAVDDPPVPPPPVPAPEADPDSPNFPTNVLFFGSQDEVSTGRAAHHQQQSPAHSSETTVSSQQSEGEADEAAGEAARALGLRRLIGCGGASPPPGAERDIEMGLVAGEGLGR